MVKVKTKNFRKKANQRFSGFSQSFNFQKGGLSPVIATVLLIALVVVLAAIIFLWARGFIGEQIEKYGQPIEQICEQVDFDIELVSSTGIKYIEVANRGNVNIYALEIKEISGGDSEIHAFKFEIPAGGANSTTISLSTTNPEKLIILPQILGTVKGKQLNKAVTCLEQGKTINLQ